MSTVSPVPYIWYKFDTLSSSKVVNSGSAGASLDATLNNGASVMSTESPTGSLCLNLTNTPTKSSGDPTGQYLSMPPFTLGGPFSCSCWFKKPRADEDWARIFDFSFSLSSPKLLSLAFATTWGQILIVKNDSNGASDLYVNHYTNYCDNKWHHIVVVSDGSNVTLYIDNVKFDTSTFTTLENTQRVNNYIGRSAHPDNAYATMQIDDFRLYTTPLTVSDIATLFTYKKPQQSLTTSSASSASASGASASASITLDQTTISILIAIFVVVIIGIAYMFS